MPRAVIVARIDNEITARTPYRRGRSFKGLLSYLFEGARHAPHPERVLHAETVNIWSDLADTAHEMATTWESRFRLMNAAGLSPRNGSDNKAPVYHLVLSWRPDEDPPPPQEMAEHARQLLHLIGLGEHEAALVVHGDTANPHIHVVANTVHPITGRTAPLRFDKRIMQEYAARYEQLRGKVVCAGRLPPDARGEFNRAAAPGKRRVNRQRWSREREAVLGAKRAVLPSVILDHLTRHHSTFTPAQLASAVTTATASPKEFSAVCAAVLASPDLVKLQDAELQTRYTTRAQQAAEQRLAESAARLAGSIGHPVTTIALTAAIQRFAGAEQQQVREALSHVLDERGLSIVVGYAGAGKSTLLRSAAQAWSSSRYRVRGLALAGRAAEGLEADAGIESGTIVAFLLALERKSITLSARDVLVVDEAGMVGSHQLDRITHAARLAGAKVVLVGDPEQLQAIDAGGPLRYLVEHYEHATLSTIWRQRAPWMREATRDLAEGRTDAALSAYEARGMVYEHQNVQEATAVLLDQWQAGRDLGGTQLMLTATNAHARQINLAARERLKAVAMLGPDHVCNTAEGPTSFATGDRVIFRRNDRLLNVKNGSTGTIAAIAGNMLVIAVDGGSARIVSVDLSAYPHVSHGYAVTIHKSQGATVDRAYVLASRGMDRHSAYVAMSRHRDRVSMHWTRDQFAYRGALTRRLGRARLKDLTLDYEAALEASAADIMRSAEEMTSSETALWEQLYDTQRREAAALQGMSALRYAFWFAANLGRFTRNGAITLARLHERERGRLAATLQDNRRLPLGRYGIPLIVRDATHELLAGNHPYVRRHSPRPPQ